MRTSFLVSFVPAGRVLAAVTTSTESAVDGDKADKVANTAMIAQPAAILRRCQLNARRASVSQVGLALGRLADDGAVGELVMPELWACQTQSFSYPQRKLTKLSSVDNPFGGLWACDSRSHSAELAELDDDDPSEEVVDLLVLSEPALADDSLAGVARLPESLT